MNRPELDGQAIDQALMRSADGVCVINGDSKVLLWNRAAERITGYTAREVVGRSCCDVFSGRDEHGNRLCYPGCQVTTLAAAGDSVESFDMRTHTKTRQPIWLNISVLVMPGNGRGNGHPPARGPVVHLFRDVTAARELVRLIHERLTAAAAGPDDGSSAATLTRRELDVVRLLAGGGNTKRIAEHLHVSPATVRNHVQNIFSKLGVHSRLEAVAFVNRHRLL